MGIGVKIGKHSLHRGITHSCYKYKNKIGDKGPRSWLRREIIPMDEHFATRPMSDPVITDEFIEIDPTSYLYPLLGGGLALFLMLVSAYMHIFVEADGTADGWDRWIFSISSIALLVIIIYYITMPKKEIILNRLEGTITFPGYMWYDNITMPFNKIKFGFTSGGTNGIGAYQLLIIRPDRFGSILSFPFSSGNCYRDLSHITWYMDKNRPLPPQKEFDPYREQDFQRRKKKRFPKPLFPSEILTAEATAEWQKERERYWKDKVRAN